MKTQLTPAPETPTPEPVTFPALYRARPTSLVVLFAGPKQGTVLRPGDTSYAVGHPSGAWRDCTVDLEHWERLPEGRSVTLSN